MLDRISGMGYGTRPCANCESEPVDFDLVHFCSEECLDEYEGTDED